MATTPRFNLPLIAGTDPVDVVAHFDALSNAVDSNLEGFGQGTYAARPAAETPGRWYYVTDNTLNGGLFYDTGSAWIRISPSPWIAWTPSVSLGDGGGGTVGNVTFVNESYAPGQYFYQVLPGNKVRVHIRGSWHLSGTQRFVQINWSLPIPALATNGDMYIGKAEAMNDVARVQVVGSSLAVLPYGSYPAAGGSTGQWPVDNFGRYITVEAEYRTS